MNESRIESAVLIPLYRVGAPDGETHIVLIRRSHGGSHGGHLAFPGGKRDPLDRSMRDTALRESYEEIGLPPENVEILAELPAVDTRTSGFRIYPFLGRIVRPAQWRPDEREVAEVLEFPVRALANPAAHGEEVKQFEGWSEPQHVPFLRVPQGQVWGATYRILRAVIPRVLAGEWKI